MYENEKAIIEIERQYSPVIISVYERKTGSLRRDPSLLAYDINTQKILGVGEEAESLREACDGSVAVLSPLKQGMIADYIIGVRMFEELIRRAWGRKFRRPAVTVCIPPQATQVECKAFTEAFHQAGAKKVLLTERTFEETIQNSGDPADVIVRIGRGEDIGNHSDPEKWEEVFRNMIPHDSYTARLTGGQGGRCSVRLAGRVHRVSFQFQAVRTFWLLEEEMALKGLYSEEELRMHGQKQFPNVIYEIKNRKYGWFAASAFGERDQDLKLKHYLIAVLDCKIEVVTEYPPNIVIDREVGCD